MIGQHEYREGFAGGICSAPFVGASCGLPPKHSAHERSLRPAITSAIGYEPVMVSLSPGVGGLTHRTAQDRDELVQRIGDTMDRYVAEAQAVALLEAAERIQALHPGETKASVDFLRRLAAEVSGSVE